MVCSHDTTDENGRRNGEIFQNVEKKSFELFYFTD